MKRLFLLIACAGMSISLSIGFAGAGKADAATIIAGQGSGTKAVTYAVPVYIDDILVDGMFLSAQNGLYGDKEYTALKGQLNFLKAEIAELEKDSDEYKEKLSEINMVWGKISILLGELNSQVDAQNQSIIQIAEEYQCFTFTNYGFYDINNYYTEETSL